MTRRLPVELGLLLAAQFVSCALNDSFYLVASGGRSNASNGGAGNAGGAVSSGGNLSGGASANGGTVTSGGVSSSDSGGSTVTLASGGALLSSGGTSALGGQTGTSTLGQGGTDATAGASEEGGAAGSSRECSFSDPEPLTGLGVNVDMWSPSLSADGTTLYFAGWDGNSEHIYSATRSGTSTQFSRAVRLPSVNSITGAEGTPYVSFDDLTLYFYSTRAGGDGGRNIWSASRRNGNTNTNFVAPAPLDVVNSDSDDHLPWLSRDELTLLFVSNRPGLGQSDIWRATRAHKADAFSSPMLLPKINSSARDERPALTRDGLTLFFTSDRGTASDLDLYVAERSDTQAEFSKPVAVDALNSPAIDADPALSADEAELFFASSRQGSAGLWRALRVCH